MRYKKGTWPCMHAIYRNLNAWKNFNIDKDLKFGKCILNEFIK